MPPRPVILLVEDSEDDAFFFRHALKKSGLDFTLVHVTDGGAARRHLEPLLSPEDNPNPAPDFIYLDLKVPTFTGFELLAWIREKKLEGRFEVIVLSGSEHTSDLERAKGLGAADYCVKPISVEQLRARIEPWLAATPRPPTTPLQPLAAPA